jgi:monofunctional glycosyltransferase
VLQRSDMILRLLRDKGVLTAEEYRLALAEVPDISGMQKKVDQSISGKVRKFFKNIFSLFD